MHFSNLLDYSVASPAKGYEGSHQDEQGNVVSKLLTAILSLFLVAIGGRLIVYGVNQSREIGGRALIYVFLAWGFWLAASVIFLKSTIGLTL